MPLHCPLPPDPGQHEDSLTIPVRNMSSMQRDFIKGSVIYARDHYDWALGSQLKSWRISPSDLHRESFESEDDDD